MNAERLLTHYERIADELDAIPRLRRFIFDLAVRGKLVPQDPNDEPVAVELIRKKLDRKQPAGRTGADLGPVTFQEAPVDIPSTWKWSRLFQLCVADAPIVYGILQPGPDVRPTGVPYIRPSEIENGHIILSDIRHTTREIANRYSRASVQTGDLVLTIVGTIGAIAVVPKELHGGNITQSSCRLRVDSRLIEPAFLLHALQSKCVGDQIDRMKLGTAVPRLNIAHVRAIAVPLPPVAEQCRIVDKINELMALCDRLVAARATREATRDRLTAASLARVNAPNPDTFRDDARFALDALPALTTRPQQIKQLRQTILNLAVRGKLVLQDPNEEPASELLERIAKEKARLLKIGSIKADKLLAPLEQDDAQFGLPSSWKWCRLRALASTLGDGLHGTPNYSEGSDCYFINGNNLENGKIVIKPNTKTVSLDEMQKHKKLLTSNSVLVSINGTLGKVAFYNGEKIILGKSACYFNLTDLTNKEFVKVVLDSPYFVDYAVRNETGATIMNLSLKAMNEFPIPVPPLAEQSRIVAKVGVLMTLCERLEASLISAAEGRRRLLDALLAEALAPNEALDREAAE